MKTIWWSNVVQFNFWAEQSTQKITDKNTRSSVDWNLAIDHELNDVYQFTVESLDDIMNKKTERIFNFKYDWEELGIDISISFSTKEHLGSGLSLEDFALKVFFKENPTFDINTQYFVTLIWVVNQEWDLIPNKEHLRNKQSVDYFCFMSIICQLYHVRKEFY
jgi:hypothetical protein